MTQKYGAHTEEVEEIIYRLRAMTFQEAKALQAAYEATPPEVRYAVRCAAKEAVSHNAEWQAARFDALNSVWYAARASAWYAAWDAALDAILAIFARDLIISEHYALLYRPWASAMVEGR